MANNSGGNTLKTVGILALLYFLVTRAGFAVGDRLSFRKPKVKIVGINLQGINLEIKWPLQNGNPFPLSLDFFNGWLYYGTYQMAAINIPGPVSVPGGEAKTLIVNAFVPYQSAAGNIYDMVQNGTWWQSFAIGGMASVKGVTFNVPPIGIQIL